MPIFEKESALLTVTATQLDALTPSQLEAALVEVTAGKNVVTLAKAELNAIVAEITNMVRNGKSEARRQVEQNDENREERKVERE